MIPTGYTNRHGYTDWVHTGVTIGNLGLAMAWKRGEPAPNVVEHRKTIADMRSTIDDYVARGTPMGENSLLYCYKTHIVVTLLGPDYWWTPDCDCCKH